MVEFSPQTNAVAVVTGGGSGIGRALAFECRERGCGAVLVVDRDREGAEETARLVGASAVATTLDVTDADAVADFVRTAERKYDAIHTWFSNAGVHLGAGLGREDEWRRSLDVNLIGHVHAARAVLPGMERRGAGHFVLTASAAGLLTDLRSAPYSASKHALVGLAEWLAIGVADGVSIHCVCPEGVRTGMTQADSLKVANGIEFLDPDAVATMVFEAMDRGEFLIATHPRTVEFERRRCSDRSRWILGMRRARSTALGRTGLFQEVLGVDCDDSY